MLLSLICTTYTTRRSVSTRSQSFKKQSFSPQRDQITFSQCPQASRRHGHSPGSSSISTFEGFSVSYPASFCLPIQPSRAKKADCSSAVLNVNVRSRDPCI